MQGEIWVLQKLLALLQSLRERGLCFIFTGNRRTDAKSIKPTGTSTMTSYPSQWNPEVIVMLSKTAAICKAKKFAFSGGDQSLQSAPHTSDSLNDSIGQRFQKARQTSKKSVKSISGNFVQ